MQKKLLLLFVYITFCSDGLLTAQITVTNTTFPVAGDTLRTATTLNPQGITITAPGGPYAWDFGTLAPSTQQMTVYEPASNGAASSNYPNAELVVINAGTETYYDVSASIFASLGVNSPALAGIIPFATNAIFSPPLAERRAPLSFFDINQSATDATVAIPVSAIEEYLDSLGVPGLELADSIRIRLRILRLDVVDGWGTLTIPGGTYDVLRATRTDMTGTYVDVHTIFGWLDVTDQIGMFVGDFFGIDTLRTYHFISNTVKEPIAVLTMNNSQTVVQQIEYKDNGITSALNPVRTERLQVIVSPNPAFDYTIFELKNCTPGDYTLQLFDANGQIVLVKEFTSTHETVSLSALGSGVYLYNVLDGGNQIIATGKLIKAIP